MGIVVLGAVFVDIKGYPLEQFVPTGRNVGKTETVHGGVSRNVVEDIANVELKPTFVSLVDDNGSGEDVINKLKDHKVNTKFMRKVKDGMGTWLAIFDNRGDVYASISKRPDLGYIDHILDKHGKEIFKDCDSIVLEMDMEKDTVRRVFEYAEKYHKKVMGVVSNIYLAVKRRDYLQKCECFVCNQQEAGVFFSEEYENKSPEEMLEILPDRVNSANLKSMVITMGDKGAVFADNKGNKGYVPPMKVEVKDTTGCGDAFFSGVAIGLTYGKTLEESCQIGTRLAASVITTMDNVCPRFLPSEFGIEIK